MEAILDDLNPSQREAAQHIDGTLLILAGAGSGKTKTITSRLAYLIGEVGIDPRSTLTLTFTNKAALEMRNRALSMLEGNYTYPPQLLTFHKFGLLFLKFHIDKLGRKNNFVIIDSDDRKRLVKQIAKDLKIDINTPFILSEISKCKNSCVEPQMAKESAQLEDYKKAALVYEKYQEEIFDNNLVDFDDLLMLTHKILSVHEDIRVATSQKYQYIMVDEYQDTNELQLRILELLASEHGNLCVVGDDDQSIYGWRGANIRNILEFDQQFQNTKVVKLQTNYRSTTPILEAANHLIEHNRNRLKKELVSYRGEGNSVKLLHCLDETHEARSIAREIKELIQKGTHPDEIAVLYRINALSRSLEDGFNKEKLPFKLVGGMRFYERAEIKDIISYLRIILNPNDDFSLLRIINKPKRGAGKVSLDKLTHEAHQNNLSLYEYLASTPLFASSKKLSATLKTFITSIENLSSSSQISPLAMMDEFEHAIGLKAFYAKTVDGEEKVKNIEEFYGYFRDAFEKFPQMSLEEFLNDISLQSDQDQLAHEQINIMSIHAAKGLEFEHVYIIGLEEEFFPLLGENTNIEEERRLGYVAITRAKTHLTLCYVDSRFYKGQRAMIKKSRFLGECGIIKNTSLKVTKSAQYKKGDLVQHKIFGMGRIEAVAKVGNEYKLKINFGGNKREILSSFVQPI